MGIFYLGLPLVVVEGSAHSAGRLVLNAVNIYQILSIVSVRSVRMTDIDKILGERVEVADIAEKMIRAANQIYDYKIAMAFGLEPPEDFEKGNPDRQAEILAIVEPFLEQYEQIREIEASTSEEVISLLSKGKISPKEAIELLKFLKTKIEVEGKELEQEVKSLLIKKVEDEEANDQQSP